MNSFERYLRQQNVVIGIESGNHLTDEDGSSSEEPFYHALIYLEKNIDYERIFMDSDLNEFIDYAMNYKNYITETLNDIEVEINIYKNPNQEKGEKTYSVPIW